MRHNPRPQEVYRHFKGNLYQIRTLARHSETRETMVVYQAMYGAFEIYVQPMSMFMEEIDRAKYPDAAQRFCFELLQEPEEGEKPVDLSGLPAGKEDAVLPEEQSAEGETGFAVSKPALSETAEPEEQLHIDPLVLAFLDADSYEQKLSILDSLHNRITDDMINVMAVSSDLEIKEGDVEDRYMELRSCLRTFEKFECTRLR